MFKMIGLFWLIFLGGVWSIDTLDEVELSEGSISFPTLDVIESVMRSSFENASRTNLIGTRAESSNLRRPNFPQEAASYRHHGIHAANDQSWALECVWEAMKTTARHLPQLVESSSSLRTMDVDSKLVEVSSLCRSLASKNCGAHFHVQGCNPYDVYRKIDGSCNNLQNTLWGAAPQPFERYLMADYGKAVKGDAGFRTSKKGKELPEPRAISRVLSSSKQRDTPEVTLMLMQWGQFIDHDVTLTPEREHHEPVDGSKTIECCDSGHLSSSDEEKLGNDCRPISVEGDSYYKNNNRECIRFVRSMPATTGCSFTPMEQINQNTAFVDGSQIYGSEKEVADFVRTKSRGLLNITEHKGNGAALPPRGGDNHSEPCPLPESMDKCFLAGDIRVDEMPGLTAMHTAFIRLHNLIAEGLYNINPHWQDDDEKIFQEARRIVSAIIQQITYRDWLPHVVGPTLMKELDLGTGKYGYKDTYNSNTNPTIRNVFATAAFRFGHTLLTDFVKAATDEMTLPLEGHFFNTTVVESDGTSPSSLLKGLSRCPSEPIDGFVANTFTDKLFAAEPAGDGNFYGLDLVSLNIQRGRDHGIPSYRKWREFCDLSDVRNFRKLGKVMEKPLALKLKEIYNKIDDVDLFPAALSEYPLKDGLLGPTFSCILARQFAQIKHGDRFWYERDNQPKPFTPGQLSAIRSQGLASVLCAVSEHTAYGFQPDPFLVSDSPGNNVMDCSSYNFISLLPWKESSPVTGNPRSFSSSAYDSTASYSSTSWRYSWWYTT